MISIEILEFYRFFLPEENLDLDDTMFFVEIFDLVTIWPKETHLGA